MPLRNIPLLIGSGISSICMTRLGLRGSFEHARGRYIPTKPLRVEGSFIFEKMGFLMQL